MVLLVLSIGPAFDCAEIQALHCVESGAERLPAQISLSGSILVSDACFWLSIISDLAVSLVQALRCDGLEEGRIAACPADGSASGNPSLDPHLDPWEQHHSRRSFVHSARFCLA